MLRSRQGITVTPPALEGEFGRVLTDRFQQSCMPVETC
ncbi:hypothetical protein MPL1032_240311 [Mesorhizobium plurifarium]|uniref:Uncharacterized protein n=1 Tax=Mesorhizobium plurifarium TaxID=69974 RepID=A0A0K2W1H8_MESPL|nr:hypothetical protein MPL1032_240311 [Mesorhizobium plurifarium]